MNKRILLSLLIMSSTSVYTMESDTWSLSAFSLRSFLPTWSSPDQVQYESKLTSDIRASKSKFESQLQFNSITEYFFKPIATALLVDLYIDKIETDPNRFVEFCYHYNYSNLINLDFNDPAIQGCLNAQIDGYSPLGASIISKGTPIEKKHNLIHKLLKNSFKPTPKDIELAELALYDEIGEHQITMLHLLHTHSLPQEIRKQIIGYMVQLFNNEFWLLPENY